MLTRLGSMGRVGGAVLLVMALSGVAIGAALVADTTPPASEALDPNDVVDTTATFEDEDGDSVDDDCQDAVVPNVGAAAAALAAVDLDGNGEISTSEAAKSDRTGGKNCNHGGYVSGVARAEDGEADTAAPADCAVNVKPEAPADGDQTTDAEPNAHGKAVSEVAQSDAVGGKNCNHGGAVSGAAKAGHAASNDRAAKNSHATKNSHADRAAKGHGKGHGQDR